ncbi:MAG: hypothetical protein ACRD0A_20670 [Acidimicrobiales bacterium]
MKWKALGPGGSVITESRLAKHWPDALGRPFHEVRIETNSHNVTLVFSELTVEQVDPGYVPFTVGPTGPDGKIPFE